MARKCISTVLALLIPLCSLPAADVIPGRWEKVDFLVSKTPVLIKMSSGEEFEATFFSSDRAVLLVVDAGGGLRRVRKAEVETVIADKYDDRLKNGAISGLLVGVGGAALLTFVPRDSEHDRRVSTAVFKGVLLGMVGMGLGALVDYHHKGREVLYEARKR